MTDVSLVDRLAAQPKLAAIPRAELEWLVAHGELERLYFSDHDNSATLRSETLGDTWTITQVWSCPC